MRERQEKTGETGKEEQPERYRLLPVSPRDHGECKEVAGGVLTCCHCQLLEILELEHEGHEMKIPIKEKGAPKCFMNMENLSNCFKAVAKLTPPLEHRGIAASDFAHGSTKLVASFVWRLMKRYDEPRSDIEIIKWYAARVKPFDIIIDIDEPIPATLPGVPFQALIESQLTYGLHP